MDIAISVKDLKVNQLIEVLNKIESTSSFLITDYNGKEYSFGELKKSNGGGK